MKLRPSTLLITLAAFSAAALAAHKYDTSKSTTLSGSVTKVEWNNKDYVKIHMNAQGNKGKTTDWEIQTVPASTLQSDGIASGSLKAGDQIMVKGYQAANGSPHMLAQSITLADGQNVAVNAQEDSGQQPVQTSANTQPQSSQLNAQQSANSQPSDQQGALPQTASNMPLIGLIGLLSLTAGGLLVSRRRVN